MLVAYICHQISGDVSNNLMSIRAIVREINLTMPDTVPFVPYFADCRALDDSNISERRRGFKNNEYILRSGIVNALWLYGPRISAGMEEEMKIAVAMNIKIVAKSENINENQINSIIRSWKV